MVQRTNLYKVYNYHDNRAHGYERSRILSRLVGYDMVCVSLCGRVCGNFVVTLWKLCNNFGDNLQLNWVWIVQLLTSK
jgi:hypothetical protein